MRARISIVSLVALALVILCGFQRGVQVIVSPAPVAGGVTWTLIQGSGAAARNFTCATAACATGTLTATTAGNLEIIAWASFAENPSVPPLTSNAVSGDTMTHCTGFPQKYNYNAGSSYNLVDCWYKLSATGGATSFTNTPTWGGADFGQAQDIQFLEVHRSTGTATFDAANTSQSNNCVSNLCAAPTLTMGGTSDFCIQFIAIASNPPTAISGTYTNPAVFDPTNVQAGFAGALNVASYSAPNWSATHSGSDGAQAAVACWN